MSKSNSKNKKGVEVEKTTKKSSPEAPSKKFPIVGIGASAGGLEAFTSLLEALPTDTGMGFIFIQHLDPTHESLGPEILSRSTRMKVRQVAESMRVNPNCVYLIPPNHNMVLTQGVLTLLPRTETRGQHLIIDSFFQSLASDQGGRAVGVILSGAASDGTQGLRAIKAEGGLSIAQDPKTAKHSDMPKNAIAAGFVDLILPPAEIARELARISKHPYIAAACELTSETQTGSDQHIQDKQEDETPKDAALRKIFAMLRVYSRIDFSNYKYATLTRRIQRRMMVRRTETLEDYAKYLRENNDEVKSLFNDILINVTWFFRDPESYKALAEQVFPQLIAQRASESPIRIWVAACSTGEEAYSLAISLVEFLGESGTQFPIQIFATDISEPCLKKARAGIYSESNLRGVSKERLTRFFDKVDGGYKINKSIRQMCLFSRHDLSGDPAFGKLDLISCRNLLIYFGVILQKRVIPVFHYALKLGGFLWLGKSESTGSSGKLFSLIDKTHKIYSKANVQTPMTFRFPVSAYVPEAPESPPSKAPVRDKTTSDFDKLVDRIAVSKYAPPSVVVNYDLEILHFRGETGPYLQITSGPPSSNLFKMIRPDLLHTLRMSIHEARAQNRQARHEGLSFDLDGNRRTVGIQVVPTNPHEPQNQRNFLIFFEEPTSNSSPAKKIPAKRGSKAEPEKSGPSQHELRLAQLEQESSSNKLLQQAMFEDFEASREELTAGNEELQSTNEELQSTNEELETAKEEVQSSNEELTTVNDELQNRNTELTVLTSDLNNILSSADIPLVIVDSDHRIRRFTPQAAKAFSFIDSDLGRPLGDIRATFDLDLDGLVSEVIESLIPLEREIQDREGHWMRLQIRPFKTIDSRIDGAVIALIDVDDLKRLTDDLKSSSEQLSADYSALKLLNELGTAIFRPIGLQEMLEAVIDAAIALTHAPMGNIQLFDPVSKSLKIVAHRGFKAPFLEHFSEVAHGPAVCGEAMRTNKRVIVEDVSKSPIFVGTPTMAIMKEAGVGAVQSTPLTGRDNRFLGMFSTHWREPHVLDNRTQQMLDLLAHKAAIAIENRQREQSLSDATQEVENERENFRNLFKQTPEMVCILSGPEHVFDFVNEAHVRALGFNATGMPVRGAQPESVEVHGILDEVYRSGKTAELHEIPVTVTDRLRHFNLTYAARRDRSGQINGVMILGVEVTEQVQARKRIEEYARELELSQKESTDILESMADAFIALDKNYKVLTVNRHQERISGLSRDKTLGKNHWETWPRENAPQIWDIYEKVMHERIAVHIEDYHPFLNVWFSLDVYPTPNGGLAAFFRDITSQKNALLTVQSQRERFSRLAGASGIGAWYCDLPFSDLTWDAKVKEHFWLPESAHVTIDTFYERIHPEDRELTRKAIEESIQSHSRYEIEYRTTQQSNESEIKWIRAIGWTDYSSSGDPIRFDGITLDITEHKRREHHAAFLDKLSQALALLHSPEEIVRAAGEALGACLDISFVHLVGVKLEPGDEATEAIFTVHATWEREGLIVASGEYRAGDYLTEEFLRAARAGETLVIRDTDTDPRVDAEGFRSTGIRAVVVVPILDDDEWPGLIAVGTPGVRDWRPDEITLIAELAHRIFLLFERVCADAALRASRAELTEADRRKDEFISMLAHELRNPLAPIRMGLELIRLAGDTPGSVEPVRAIMERQIGHMVRLIDDLLDVSRITSGKFKLQPEPTPLDMLVNDAIEANRAAIAAKQIMLSVNLPTTLCVLDVDPTRFTQVISNLLHNSTKFTEPGGYIGVYAHVGGADGGQLMELSLSVIDSGIGISAELLPHIFEQFTQGERGSSVPGLGIGLTLARQLVEMHGGQIGARSDGPGTGSEFVIRLPISATDVQPRGAEQTTVRSLARRIVVIDDNHDAANATAMLVDALGGEFRVAYDGISGVREVLAYRPEIVLLDIGMPGLDGYETCSRIRRELGRGVIIVALTGFGREQDRDKAYQSGFDAHLTKPVDPKELARFLSELPLIPM